MLKNSIGSILVTMDFAALHLAVLHRITIEERQNVGATMRATLLSVLLTAAGPTLAHPNPNKRNYKAFNCYFANITCCKKYI